MWNLPSNLFNVLIWAIYNARTAAECRCERPLEDAPMDYAGAHEIVSDFERLVCALPRNLFAEPAARNGTLQ